jgi:capsular exopolysaccharide synthesis family protein
MATDQFLKPEDALAPPPKKNGGYDETLPFENLDIVELIAIVQRRWLWIAATVVLVLFLGSFWTFTRPWLYASKAEITVYSPSAQRTDSPGGLATINKLEDLALNRSIATQMRLMRSSEFITEAFLALPEKTRDAGFADFSPGDLVTLTLDSNDSVITILAKAKTPEAAREFVDSIVATFIKRDLAESRTTVQTALKYIEDETKRVTDEMRQARNDVARFEMQYGLIDEKGRLSQFKDRIASLTLELEQARQDTVLNTELMTALREKLAEEERTILVDVTEEQNPIVDKIDAQIQDLELKRADLLLVFVSDAPEVRRVDRSIAAATVMRKKYLETRITKRTSSVNPLFQQLQSTYIDANTSAEVAGIRAAVLSRELERRKRILTTLPALEIRAGEMQSRVAQLDQTLAQLNQNYQSMRIAEASTVSNVRVLSTAKVDGTVVYPNFLKNIALALLLGLLVAAGITALIEAFDDRIHGQRYVERLSDRPILAHVPLVRDDNMRITFSGDHDYRHSPMLESMRLLRSNIAFASMDKPLRTIVVTSPGTGEGKSITSANLATVLAMDGKRVVILDGDMRRPTIHKLFHLQRDVGLTQVVTDTATLDEALQPTNIKGLLALATGPLPPNPPEVLNSQRVRLLVDELAQRFDYVIIDTPPAAGLSDVAVLAGFVDGILMVVSADETHRGHLSLALRTLNQLNAPILGFVLNKIDQSKFGYGYYYSNYYYYYSSAVDSDGEPLNEKKKRRHRHRRRKDLVNSGAEKKEP